QEAVEDGGRLVTEAERVQPQRAARGEARRGGEVEAARCLRREDAGLPARGPAVAVQAEQLVEQRLDVVRSRGVELQRCQPLGAAAVVACPLREPGARGR